MSLRLVSLSLLLLVMCAQPARATEAQQARARELFAQGQAAFARDAYKEAHDLFKKAYLLYPAPEFLYNMASALQGAGRPHDAAEDLRAFLRIRPDFTERVELEGRIRALEEAQHILDGERALHQPVPGLITLQGAPRPTSTWTRRKTLITVLSTVGAVLVVGGVATGVVLGLHDWHTGSTFGTQTVTP